MSVKKWTDSEHITLRRMLTLEMPINDIAIKMGRTQAAIRSKTNTIRDIDSGNHWTRPEISQLRALTKSGKKTQAVANILGRDVSSVESKKRSLGLLGEKNKILNKHKFPKSENVEIRWEKLMKDKVFTDIFIKKNQRNNVSRGYVNDRA